MRRERPHPGAKLCFTDHDGYRFHVILTDQTEPDIAVLEYRHRQHAHVEDRIPDDKETRRGEVPVQGVRAQRGVGRDGNARARPARLGPSARSRRGTGHGRAHAASPPAPACRRAARVLRAPREAPPTEHLTVHGGAPRRPPEAQNASRRRMTPATSPPHHQAALRPRRRLPLDAHRRHTRPSVPSAPLGAAFLKVSCLWRAFREELFSGLNHRPDDHAHGPRSPRQV